MLTKGPYVHHKQDMCLCAKKKTQIFVSPCVSWYLYLFPFILTISCLIVGRLMQAECGYYSEFTVKSDSDLVIILFLIAQLLTRVQPCSLNQKILTENSQSFYSHSLHTLTKTWLDGQQHLLIKY